LRCSGVFLAAPGALGEVLFLVERWEEGDGRKGLLKGIAAGLGGAAQPVGLRKNPMRTLCHHQYDFTGRSLAHSGQALVSLAVFFNKTLTDKSKEEPRAKRP